MVGYFRDVGTVISTLEPPSPYSPLAKFQRTDHDTGPSHPSRVPGPVIYPSPTFVSEEIFVLQSERFPGT